MKKLVYLAVVVLFAACSDDEDFNDTIVPTDAIIESFNNEFPNAKNVEWTTEAGGYYIVEFDRSASTATPTSIQSTEVWYTADGKYKLIETDFEYLTELPAPIQTAVNSWLTDRLNSSQQKFLVDDIDFIQRFDETDVYKVEVEYENGEATDIEYELYFNNDGELIAEILDVDGNENEDTVTPIPSEIKSYINENYSDVIILGVDIELENNAKVYDVELIAGQTEGALTNIEFELLFAFATNEFLREEADLKFSQAPIALQDALKVIVPTASDLNIEIERITLAGQKAVYKIDADDDAEVLDDKIFNADGTKVK